jgi:hypothetical protein
MRWSGVWMMHSCACSCTAEGRRACRWGTGAVEVRVRRTRGRCDRRWPRRCARAGCLAWLLRRPTPAASSLRRHPMRTAGCGCACNPSPSRGAQDEATSSNLQRHAIRTAGSEATDCLLRWVRLEYVQGELAESDKALAATAASSATGERPRGGGGAGAGTGELAESDKALAATAASSATGGWAAHRHACGWAGGGRGKGSVLGHCRPSCCPLAARELAPAPRAPAGRPPLLCCHACRGWCRGSHGSGGHPHARRAGAGGQGAASGRQWPTGPTAGKPEQRSWRGGGVGGAGIWAGAGRAPGGWGGGSRPAGLPGALC